MKEKFLTSLWISWRLLRSNNKNFFNITGWVSVLGLTVGVASLVVSMAVVSGFERTLRQSVIDVTGDIRIIKAGAAVEEDLGEAIQKVEPAVKEILRFASLEGLVANQGSMGSAFIQGVETSQLDKVLRLDKKIVDGDFQSQRLLMPADSDPSNSVYPVLIGKELARKLKLQRGDKFRMVIPLMNQLDPAQFRRKVASLSVIGILDLGKYEYDERMIVMDLAAAQNLAEIGQRAQGIIVKLQDSNKARDVSRRLSRILGPSYRVSDWRDINENLFQAVEIERIVIFFVVLIIVVAAAFNVASTLYINVIRRFAAIGIMKSMGLSRRELIRMFSFQGIWIGGLGLTAGLVLGTLLCFVFTWAEQKFGLIPGSIYKIDRIDLYLRFWDVVMISFATLLISFLATLSPALRGARLSPIEGLRNE